MAHTFRKALAIVSSLPAMVFIALLRLYQRTLSPDHGPLRHLYPYGFCRHEPTCSEFAIASLKTVSFPRAIGSIIKRLVSCNPGTKPTDKKIITVLQKL